MSARRKPGSGTVISAMWIVSTPGLVAVAVFTTVFNLLKFATPLYLLQVLDRVPASRSIETLVMLTIAVLIAVFCGLALDIVRRRMLVRWSNWIEVHLAPRILHQGLSEGRHGRSEQDTTRGLSDVSKLRGFVSDSLASWLDVVFAPLFFLATFFVHPVLGMVSLGALVLLVIVSFVADAVTRDSRRAAGDAGREAGSILSVAEQNRESVGGLAMADALADRWRAASTSQVEERNTSRGMQVTFRAIQSTLSQLLRIAMIAVGIWLVVQGTLSLGGMFAARVLAGFGFTLAERALGKWRNLRETLTAYRAIRKRLTITDVSTISILPDVEGHDIIADSVSFRYPGERRDLYRRLSFRLPPGRMLLVSGGAGVGKSTLSRLMVGVLTPRDGQIRLGDVDISRLPSELRARLISYLPQHTEIFEGTVRENIARMEVGDLTEVMAAAKLVGIHETLIHLPEGYDTMIGRDYPALSGSQRKRIAMARAFYGKPRLIVLDEPVANLDRPSRRIMEAALADLKAGGASLVVTQSIHSEQLARMADEILTLTDGKHDLQTAADRADNASSDKVRRIK